MATGEEIRIEFASAQELAEAHARDLRNGGAMFRGEIAAAEGEIRPVVLVHPADGAALALPARVVWVGEKDGARVVGLAFSGFGPELRDRIARFVEGEREAPAAGRARTPPQTVHDRLRGLSVAEQHRIAREGEPNERVILERIYGKIVWEPLLRNPRITIPEVARIANMGALPGPLVDLIVGNAAWLASPPVRRALLGHPRLGADAIAKVLRAMPQAELKLVPRQTTYSGQVREAARRLLGR